MPIELKSIDQIVSELRGETPKASIQKIALPNIKQDVGKIKDVVYDVPTSAIYDRLNDGSYVAKYENYAGAVGNENRLALQQTWYEKAGYGLVKNVRKIGNYALDATAGTVYGIMNSISTGTLSGFSNNELSKTLDDWNKELDYNLPNYYSDEEKSRNILQNLGTSNFWFNDVAGGLAFVGGVILPEIALGALTGGATLPSALAKFGLKTATKKLAKEVVDPTNYVNGSRMLAGVNEVRALDKGSDLVRGFNRAQYMSKAGDALNTGLFLARSSGFEAGMEARHNFKDAMSEYFETFEQKNGRQPTFEETQKFADNARSTSNGVFVANLAILSVSNAVMFGKMFNLKAPKFMQGANKSANRWIGLGVNTLDDGTLAVQKATRLQKFTGNTYKILSKPLVEGVYEEGLQGVSGKTMQNYLKAQYDPKQDNNYGMWASLTDAFATQYGSKEGWKEMGIGIIIGFAGGGFSNKASGGSFVQGLPGVGKNSRASASRRLADSVENANKGIETIRTMNRAGSMRNFRNNIDSKQDNFESTSAENSMLNAQFIRTQEHVKSSNQIIKDFNSVIDNMELDEASLSLVGEQNVDSYKATLKEEFQKSADDYEFAKNTVEALGLNKKLSKLPNGDIVEVGEALTMNIYAGKQALSSAQNVASQIQLLTGKDGVFDSLEFYNGLSQTRKKSIEEVRRKKTKLKQLEERAVEYGQRVAGIQVEGKRGFKQDTLEKRYTKTAEKLVLTQQQITNISKEILDIEKLAETDINAVGKGLDGKPAIKSSLTVAEALETLDQIDAYKDSLRSLGKDYEADSLEYLVTQFKIYSDAHREMTNMGRRMLDTNFFSTKEGVGLTELIVGQTYTMSEDMKKSLRDNDAIVDASLNLVGIRGYDEVDKYVQKTLEENPDLSQREKYRIESILRLQLGVQALEEQLSDLNDIGATIRSEKQNSQSPLEGDTIILRQSLDIKADSLDNLEQINLTIDKILTQIEYLRDENSGASKVLALEDDLKNLETKRAEILNTEVEEEQNEGDYQKLQDLANSLNTKGDNFALSKISEYLAKIAEDNYLFTHVTTTESAKSIFEGKMNVPLGTGISSTLTQLGIKGVTGQLEKLLNNEVVHRDLTNNSFAIIAVPKTELDGIGGRTISEKFEGWLEENNKIDEKGRYAIPNDLNLGYLSDGTFVTKEDVVGQQQEESSVKEVEDLKLIGTYPKLFELLSKGETNPITDIDNAIAEIEEKIDGFKANFKIIDSPEYLRLNELFTKRETSELTPNEEVELTTLESDINEWLLVTGTVADGIRLSDLIRQKAVLENTPITNVQEVREINPQELLGGVDIGDRKGSANYSNGQTYESVTVIRDDVTGLLAISGIKPDTLFQEVGFPFEYILNERNNILITDEVQQRINKDSSVSIKATNSNLTTSYSVVTKYSQNNVGQTVSNPLLSDYSNDFTELQQPEKIYDLVVDQQLVLEIDPQDDYNVELLDKYRQLQTSGVLDEDQIAELEDEIHTQLIADSKEIKDLEQQASKLRTKISNPETTTAVTADTRKELTKVETKISKLEDKLYSEAVKQVKKRSSTVTSEDSKQEVLDQIKQGLVIRVKDKENNFLAVLKGKNPYAVKTQEDLRFEALRDQIGSDTDLLDRLSQVNVQEQLSMTPKVKKVYLGHPNFNFVKNADGTEAVEYKKFSTEEAKKIVDIGFVSNGKITTRSKEKGLNTTFLDKFVQNSSESLIPIIVIQQGINRVAYPVRVLEKEQVDNSEFSDIFNSEASTIDKVSALNKFMAKRGVDIKQAGNAFFSNSATNLTQEFFDQKLAQLESIQYFYDLENWVNPDVFSIQEILLEQALVNINMANPFHSPKLQMDFSELEIEVTVKPETEAKKKKNKKEVVTQSVLLSLKARDAQIEAEDQLNEDC